MSAPHIKMIAESLRNCTLSRRSRGGREVQSPPSPAGSPPVTVNLNSEVPLPYHWQQCLDLRTGQIYYVNLATRERTTQDPRLLVNSYMKNGDEDDDDDDDDDEEDEEDSSDEEDDDDDSSDSSNQEYEDKYFNSDVSYGDSTSPSTSASSAYSPEVTSSSSRSHVLVAAGCPYCFMFFMVPKCDFHCPKCRRPLLNVGRSSSSSDNNDNGC